MYKITYYKSILIPYTLFAIINVLILLLASTVLQKNNMITVSDDYSEYTYLSSEISRAKTENILSF